MKVVALTVEHASQYRELMLHGYEHAPDAFTSTHEERAAMPLAWWAKRAADPMGAAIAFGVFSGEQLVGTVALEFASKPKTKHKAILIGMYVLEAWQGQGIGRQLVRAAIKHAQARPNIAVLTLTVTEGNAPAIALYESAGFRSFGVEPMAIVTPSGYKGKVHMFRAIADVNPAT